MLKNYGSAYQNTADTAIADKAVEEFLNNYKDWKEVVGCWVVSVHFSALPIEYSL